MEEKIWFTPQHYRELCTCVCRRRGWRPEDFREPAPWVDPGGGADWWKQRPKNGNDFRRALEEGDYGS
jgi:hypothetical protein